MKKCGIKFILLLIAFSLITGTMSTTAGALTDTVAKYYASTISKTMQDSLFEYFKNTYSNITDRDKCSIYYYGSTVDGSGGLYGLQLDDTIAIPESMNDCTHVGSKIVIQKDMYFCLFFQYPYSFYDAYTEGYIADGDIPYLCELSNDLFYYEAGDMDRSGALTVSDVVAMRQYIVTGIDIYDDWYILSQTDDNLYGTLDNANNSSFVKQIPLSDYLIDVDGDKHMTVSDVISLRKKIISGSCSTADDFKGFSTYGNIMLTALSQKVWMDDGITMYNNPFDNYNGKMTLWGYSAYLTAAGSAVKFSPNNPMYVDEYKKALQNVMVYKSSDRINTERGKDPETYLAFTCYPNAADAELFYDDNIWIAREFLNAYDIFGDQSYLETAEKMINYINETAWDETWGGGGFEWMDRLYMVGGSEPYQKLSSENLAIADAMLHLHSINGDESLVSRAEQIYKWVLDNLSEKKIDSDGIESYSKVYDKIVYNSNGDPVLDRGGMTYAYGMIISAGARLYDAYKVTDPDLAEKYLNYTNNFCDYSINRYTSTINSWNYQPQWQFAYPWFNALFIEGVVNYYNLNPDSAITYATRIAQATRNLCVNSFNDDGWLAVDWVKGTCSSKYYTSFDFSANIQAMFILANSFNNVTPIQIPGMV